MTPPRRQADLLPLQLPQQPEEQHPEREARDWGEDEKQEVRGYQAGGEVKAALEPGLPRRIDHGPFVLLGLLPHFSSSRLRTEYGLGRGIKLGNRWYSGECG
jgi:hypothetical protein